jgi:8-oxo-dGTP pyrophosphatase MutT (NUDIX family)
VDEALRALAARHLPTRGRVAAPSPRTRAALDPGGSRLLGGPLDELPDGALDAVALLDDELSTARPSSGGAPGQGAEELLAEAARVLRPAGAVLASARGQVHAAATGRSLGGARGYTAGELRRMLAHRGFAVELVCAPGVAGRLAAGSPRYTPALDTQPGLLDAGPVLAALGRHQPHPGDRSAAFFASLPRKVVAAAVICRAPTGEILTVYDSFRRHWTIPGGVVDADEPPQAGARRETWEEAGLDVTIRDLLGVFAARGPDRLILVFDAVPAGSTSTGRLPALRPVHAHEVAGAAWVPVEEAITRVPPHVAEQVRRCLGSPGRVWAE